LFDMTGLCVTPRSTSDEESPPFELEKDGVIVPKRKNFSQNSF